MVEVKVSSDESLGVALARFKRMCNKAGIIREARKRSFYEKPSEKRRRLALKAQRKQQQRSQRNRRSYRLRRR